MRLFISGGEIVVFKEIASEVLLIQIVSYVDLIVLRTNRHGDLLELARNSEIPVINGLTDISHPCQVFADIMTFEEKLGDIENKIVAWVGDGNNMANSWIHASKVFNFKLRLACPNERSPDNHTVQWAKDNLVDIEIMDDPLKACKDADAICTDTWVSMGDEGIINPEKIFNKFQVNEKLFKVASDNAIFMHCLPAKIDSEVTQSVLSSSKSIVLHQAKNRLVAQKGILKWLEIQLLFLFPSF